ncbi:glycosyltransferase family protein [Agromyces cerinus]|uniref:Uncharacterized protein n=1 Tax=Agromyces cerinus subsp. cerinus TaxID=232089 RepID=A0A1N6DIV6_9MICO|nr:hypothetical protein [Agromyces cerinus]SIN70593.1 hypothetical protein SAMN05443544_0276 [Agromyces cerinus subsp. cerinus]
MTIQPPSRAILITQSQLRRFAGSEIVTLELVEHFASTGSPVVVVTHAFESPMREEILNAGDVEVILMSDPNLSDRLGQYDFELVWIHHCVIPKIVAAGDIDAPIVFNHMSGVHPIEHPMLPSIERQLATLSLFNSEETMEAQSARGALASLSHERIRVFPNPAPDAFTAMPALNARARPRLAIVSNHIPDELLEAVALLEGRIDLDLFGESTAKATTQLSRITPSLLGEYDAVVTIGKTVQYALVGGRPVYCYDRFGGPGWLNPSNLEKSAHHNFSGRGFGQKTAETIADELENGLVDAKTHLDEIADRIGDCYLLSSQIPRVIESCRTSQRNTWALSREDQTALELLQDLTATWVSAVEGSAKRERGRRKGLDRIAVLEQQRAHLKAKSTAFEKQRDRARQHARELRESLDSSLAVVERERDDALFAASNSRDAADRATAAAEAVAARLDRTEREFDAFRSRRIIRLAERIARPYGAALNMVLRHRSRGTSTR